MRNCLTNIDIDYQETDSSVMKNTLNIENTFLGLCLEKGISRVSVSELAREAGINRGTFYLHFENLDDLVWNIEKKLLKKSRIVSESQKYYKGMDKYSYIYSVLKSELCSIKNDFLWYNMLLSAKGDPSFKHKVKKCIRISAEKKFNEINLPYDIVFLDYLASGAMGIFSHWIETGAKMDIDQLVRFSLLLTGDSIC